MIADVAIYILHTHDLYQGKSVGLHIFDYT